MTASVYKQIEANKLKTWLVMLFFSLFIAMVAFVFGKASGYGLSWAGIALIISGLMTLVSYYYSDKMVLTLSGARPADRVRDFDLFTVAENLSIASGLPKPKIYVISDPAPNAFATGRDPNHAVVCATTGLLEKLNRRQLEGVIGHELSHIQNYDTRLMAIVVVLVGVISILADWFMHSLWFGRGNRDNREERSSFGAVMMVIGIVFAILSPIIATIIQLAISRRREFLADASSALLTRYPEGLAQALEIISSDRNVLKSASNATAHLYIANPFKGKSIATRFSGLFDTHPPASERIKILRSM